MAALIDSLTDSEIERLYQTMTEEDLQNMLCQEKSLSRRQLIRRELRSRKKVSAPQVQIQSGPTIDKLRPEATSGEQDKRSMESSNNKDEGGRKDELLPSSVTIKKELDDLTRELRDTLDVNVRRELRSRIKALQCTLDGNAVQAPGNAATSPINTTRRISSSDNDTVVNRGITMPTKEVPSKPPENHMTSRSLPESTVQRTSSMSTTTRTQESRPVISRDEKILSSATISRPTNESTMQSESRNTSGNSKLPETADQDRTQVGNVRKVGSTPSAVSISRPKHEEVVKEDIRSSQRVENYPHQEVKVIEKNNVNLVLRLAKIDHQRSSVSWFFKEELIYRYPKSYFSSLQCATTVTGEVTLQFSDASSHKHQGRYRVEIEVDKSRIVATFDVSVQDAPKINNTPTPVSTNRKNLVINEQLSTASSSLVSDNSHTPPSQQVKCAARGNVPPQNTNVSRVSSMRELFDKTPDISLVDVKRKTAMVTPSETELEDIINQCLPGPAEPTTSKSSVRPVLLGAPTQPERRVSQTGLLKLIPVMKNKAKIARSSVQQTKEIIIMFCQHNVKEYKNVNIVNYSGSWADGLAFCALIHHFYPDSFDYSRLSATNRLHNFTLAFKTAQDLAGIMSLLDPADMVLSDNPDWKCVYTYVQSIYKKLKTHPRNVLQTVAASKD